jgi:Ion channel
VRAHPTSYPRGVPDDQSPDPEFPRDLTANIETSAEYLADRVESSAAEVSDTGARLISILRDDIVSRDGYLVVLIMMIVTILAIPIGDEFGWGQVLNAAVLAMLVLTTLSRSHVSRTLRLMGAVVTIAAIILALIGVIHGEHRSANGQLSPVWLYALAAGAYTIVLAMCFPAILRQAFRHRRIDLNTVAAALSAYLLLGLIFTAAYQFINILNPPFFVQGHQNGFTYVYFSYVTLTTVGYGDYTSANDAGRAVAILEALFGQVFLVTIVAVVVSNLGQERQPAAPLDSAERRPLLRRRSSRRDEE